MKQSWYRSIADVKHSSIDSCILDLRCDLTFDYLKNSLKAILKVLKDGAHIMFICDKHLVCRYTCLIEDIGFEIRDVIMWLHKGTVTNFDPDLTSIVLARKPLNMSIIDNVIKYDIGGINIDACRVELESNYIYKETNRKSRQDGTVFDNKHSGFKSETNNIAVANPRGRFPANTILTYDESDYDEVCGNFPIGGKNGSIGKEYAVNNIVYGKYEHCNTWEAYNDSGSASRYFYCAKRSYKDINYDTPIELLQYLVRLISPIGASILDLYTTSDEILRAIMYEDIERNSNYIYVGISENPKMIEYAGGLYLDVINIIKNNKSSIKLSDQNSHIETIKSNKRNKMLF